jgi:hypothetical protein
VPRDYVGARLVATPVASRPRLELEQGQMSTRKSISKRLRFEVFKRDSFKFRMGLSQVSNWTEFSDAIDVLILEGKRRQGEGD